MIAAAIVGYVLQSKVSSSINSTVVI